MYSFTSPTPPPHSPTRHSSPLVFTLPGPSLSLSFLSFHLTLFSLHPLSSPHLCFSSSPNPPPIFPHPLTLLLLPFLLLPFLLLTSSVPSSSLSPSLFYLTLPFLTLFLLSPSSLLLSSRLQRQLWQRKLPVVMEPLHRWTQVPLMN